MKARDERPAITTDFKNYFSQSKDDRERSPTKAETEYSGSKPSSTSVVSKKKWGQK